MSDVRFSDDLIQVIVGGIDHSIDQSSYVIDFLKGSFPNVDPTYSYVTITRNADRLIRFVMDGQDFQRWATTINVMALQPNKIPAPATATSSGIVTWFAISRSGGPSICGSVTGIGGGGDLVIPDVNITSGTLYQLSPISLTWPKSVTY